MSELWHDLRHSLRSLRRTPLLTAAAVLSLALGIGANTTVFTVVHALLFKPLPVPEQERLVTVHTRQRPAEGGAPGAPLPLSHPNFEDLCDQAEGFTGLAASLFSPVAMVAGGGEPEQLPAHLVSAGYFEVLGLRPHLGRFFLPEETRDLGAAPVAVLSHRLWQRRFAGDPAVIASIVRINGAPYQVIGVAGRGFAGTGLLAPEVWLPMTMRRQLVTGPFRDFFDSRRALMLDVVGRLAPGVSAERAEGSLAAVARRLEETYPQANRGRTLSLAPLTGATVPPAFRGLFLGAGTVLLGAVGLVLAIACANVANLLLARALARREEMAVRLCLGAGRRRVVRRLLVEGLVLSLAGGGLGVALAWWGRGALWGLRPPQLALASPDLRFDTTVLGGSLLLSLAVGVLFALAPAIQAARTDLVTAIKGRTRPPEGHRLLAPRNLLVIGQVALSTVALVAAGLFLASLRQLRAVDVGFDTDRVATVSFNLGAQGYEPARVEGFLRRAVDAARAVPGVSAAGLSTNLPLGPYPGVLRTAIPEGRDVTDPDAGLQVSTDLVGPGFLATLGVPLVAGRDFDDGDRQGSRQVLLINQTLAGRLWPGEEAVGRHLSFLGDGFSREVVGVTRDRKYESPGEEPRPHIHVPLAQEPRDYVRLFVRTDGDPAGALEAVRRQLRALDPALPLTDDRTMARVLDGAVWAPRLAALLIGGFGLLALVLATVGIYGVTAYSVERRRRELGIRMALGADRRSVLGLVVRQGMTLVAVGVAFGLAGAALAARGLAGLLYGVSALHPGVFVLAALLLAAVALVANLLPARRATAVSPVSALRAP